MRAPLSLILALALPALAHPPIESHPIGIPASRRVECTQLRTFAERLITLRSLGVPEIEAIGMMVGGTVVAQTQLDPEILAARAQILWSVAGTPHDIAQAAFALCMRDEMV